MRGVLSLQSIHFILECNQIYITLLSFQLDAGRTLVSAEAAAFQLMQFIQQALPFHFGQRQSTAQNPKFILTADTIVFMVCLQLTYGMFGLGGLLHG